MQVTFDSDTIKDFFEKRSDTAPVAELRYVLEKKVPLSFLTEISSAVQASTQKAIRKNIKVFGQYSVADSYNAFLLLTTSGILNDDDDKLSEALVHLREIYTTARNILDS